MAPRLGRMLAAEEEEEAAAEGLDIEVMPDRKRTQKVDAIENIVAGQISPCCGLRIDAYVHAPKCNVRLRPL